jgi:small subunit ribosomal protein S16
MATVIRLKRIGAKKDPAYRIVVADSRAPRDGRFIEQLGYYDPQPAEAQFRVDAERAQYWLGVGAEVSDQVRSLLKKAGVPLPQRPTPSKKDEDKSKRVRGSKTSSPREQLRRDRKRVARTERKALLTKKDEQAKVAAEAAKKKAADEAAAAKVAEEEAAAKAAEAAATKAAEEAAAAKAAEEAAAAKVAEEAAVAKVAEEAAAAKAAEEAAAAKVAEAGEPAATTESTEAAEAKPEESSSS